MTSLICLKLGVFSDLQPHLALQLLTASSGHHRSQRLQLQGLYTLDLPGYRHRLLLNNVMVLMADILAFELAHILAAECRLYLCVLPVPCTAKCCQDVGCRQIQHCASQIITLLNNPIIINSEGTVAVVFTVTPLCVTKRHVNGY